MARCFTARESPVLPIARNVALPDPPRHYRGAEGELHLRDSPRRPSLFGAERFTLMP